MKNEILILDDDGHPSDEYFKGCEKGYNRADREWKERIRKAIEELENKHANLLIERYIYWAEFKEWDEERHITEKITDWLNYGGENDFHINDDLDDKVCVHRLFIYDNWIGILNSLLKEDSRKMFCPDRHREDCLRKGLCDHDGYHGEIKQICRKTCPLGVSRCVPVDKPLHIIHDDDVTISFRTPKHVVIEVAGHEIILVF